MPFSLFGNKKAKIALSIEDDVLGTIDRLRLQLEVGFNEQAMNQFIGYAALEGAKYLEPIMEDAAPIGSEAEGDPHPGRLRNAVVARVGRFNKPSAIVGIYPGKTRDDETGAYYGRVVIAGTGTKWSRRGAVQARAELRSRWKKQDKRMGMTFNNATKRARAKVYSERLERLGLLETYERTALPARPFVRETARDHRSDVADVVRGTITELINNAALRAVVGATPVSAKGSRELVKSQRSYRKRTSGDQIANGYDVFPAGG